MGDNGLCLSTPDCASCGKTKVDVEITIDNYGGETTYDIKDASDNIVMQGSGWPANSVNSFWKCFSSGSYTFTITDAYGDGICCSYGSGGYKVEVDDKEVASGGDFGSKEEKTFDVVAGPPTAPPTVTSPTIPPPVTTPSAPISPTSPTMHPTHTPPTMYPTQTTPTMHPPTSYPTDSPPTIPPTNACKVKGEACLTHSDCCENKCNPKKLVCRK